MWNPPPPALQINLDRAPGSTNARSHPVARGLYHSNHNSPRASLNHDRGQPSVNDTNLDHNNDNFNTNIIPENHNDNRQTDYNAQAAAMNRPKITSSIPHPRLEKVGPYLTIATLQAYTILTVVRCLADPVWIVLRTGNDKTGGGPTNVTHLAEIGRLEKSFLACAIAFTMVSCVGVTLRILDKLPWLRRIPVVTAYLEAIFCIAALTSFLKTHTPLPPDGQFSHGFLACIITVLFSSIVAIMLTFDWWRGFPSAGLSATLKALIISSFVMTIVIIIGAAIYSTLEDWSFDQAVNFCIVSFATIGYGDLSPKSVAGRIIFFFYGLLGISSLGFFVVSLRNAVIEQFQWRLVERFSKPAHLTRVQTRMSSKDISYPTARFEEEQRVKLVVKRKMIVRMVCIWIVMWFGGAGVFCAFESWSFLESLYFCFVTLTTIGFGDYVPNEPGAIEFWNVYVFVGLAVFAYILSLSSESMASQIHLVDDQDEEDDDSMYGWERNEDPNAPLTTRSGILGLEGLKWLHHQQQIQQQGSNSDIQVDEEGKPIGCSSNVSNNDILNTPVGDGGLDEDWSMQSTFQRDRAKGKGSTGRILMVSAKERKQMLQAEYYANHSLPTAIRFVDTKGMPHQRTLHRELSRGSISGPSATDVPAGDQPALTYGTVGYYGTIGRRDFGGIKRGTSLRNQENLGGVRFGNHWTMYGSGTTQPLNTVQTRQLHHQPQIKFGSTGDTARGAGGQPGGGLNPADQMGFEERTESGAGYIPSCIDVFRQSNLQHLGEGAGEGSSRQSRDLDYSTVDGSPVVRVRSNSWDQFSNRQRSGPTQNEIHRWLAEDAGTLEGPNFRVVQRSPEQQQFDAELRTHGPRPSQSSDVTRVTSPPIGSGDLSNGSPHSYKHLDDKGGFSSDQEERTHQREGIAPDEISIPLTTEPVVMTLNEEEQFQADQDSLQALGAVPPPPPQGLTTLVREPTIPSTSFHETAAPSPSPHNLFLGGGIGAGYGRHAYGVLSESRSGSATSSRAEPRRASRSGSVLTPSNEGLMAPTPGPIQLFDDDDDPNCTIHASTSQPMSLFSNHPRSSQNSAAPSPAGSVYSSTRPPSVLMTIFDEPVLNLPGSRTVSRNNSVSTQQARSRAGSSALLSPGTRHFHPAARSTDRTQDAGSGTGMSTSNPPLLSPALSDISVGPLDEIRSSGSMPHFEQEFDLSYVEASSEQVEEERRQDRDLRRREREIEARLAQLGAKGRGDYQWRD